MNALIGSVADGALLHTLLKALGEAGVVDRSKVYLDAIASIEKIADQDLDQDVKDVIAGAIEHLRVHCGGKVNLPGTD